MSRMIVKLGLISGLILGIVTTLAVIYGNTLSTWRVMYSSQLGDGYWIVNEMDVDRHLSNPLFSDMHLDVTPSVSSNQRYITQASLTELSVFDHQTHTQHLFNIDFAYRFSPDSHYLLIYADNFYQMIEWFEDGTFSDPRVINPDLDLPANIHFAWSPNSDMLVFQNTPTSEGRSDLYVYSLAQGNLQNLTLETTSMTNYQPAWSPDGERIAYIGRNEGTRLGHIYTVNHDSTNHQQITDVPVPANSFVWSRDGRYLAVIMYNRALYVIPTDGDGTVAGPIDQYLEVGDVWWSANSERLVFTSWQTYDLYVVNVDGSNLTRLTYNGDFSILLP